MEDYEGTIFKGNWPTQIVLWCFRREYIFLPLPEWEKIESPDVYKRQMKNVLETMQSVSPVTYAANLLDINIFLGLILSLPASLLAVRRTAKSK